MQNKQEILEDAYEALANSVRSCKNVSNIKVEYGNAGFKSELLKDFSETAYYLTQIIKELEK